MQAVILTGGKGTRLGDLVKDIPKPLIKIGNKPVVEHQILLLKDYNIKKVWILAGYLGEKIKDYLGNGERYGLEINYLQEEEPLGTAGAFKTLKDKITDDFLLLYGDVMLDFDIEKFINWHINKKESICSMFVHPNDHPADSDLVEVDNDKVTAILPKPHTSNYHNLAAATTYIFSPKVFDYIEGKTDIGRDIMPLLIESGSVYAYNSPEYMKDMGTIERLAEVRKDYESGRINRSNKRKAIFLDRDGVINKEVNQLNKIEDFELLDSVPEAIRKMNEDYLVVVITNQPVIARGLLTEKGLDEIHKKMETELGNKRAKIDRIYYCPHHPDKGFDGEVPELKINCDCRKPEIGLIKKAEKDLNIDLEGSFFIGDATRDAKTAENAGIRFIGVATGYGCQDGKYEVNKFPIYSNLLEAYDKEIHQKTIK